MIRNVNLLNHLPEYIKEYREIQEIMNTENPEFQLAINETEKILNNQFITTCDEEGISKYESMMKIYPLASDTLESRKSRVLTRWYSALPYSWFFLIRKLNSLCGIGNYEIDMDYDKYTLHLTTHLELSGQVDELLYLLGYSVPVNIVCDVKNEIVISPQYDLNAGVAITYCDVIEIED